MAKKTKNKFKNNDGNKYANNPNYAEQVIKVNEARHNSYGEQQELMIKDR